VLPASRPRLCKAVTKSKAGIVLVTFATLVCAGAGWLALRSASESGFFEGLFRRAVREGENLEIRQRSLSLWVDATGVLRATSVRNFGAPAEFSNYWQFQIVSLIPEGKRVKPGDLLVTFDAQKINDDLQKFQNELDQAAKELDRTRVQIDLERQELNARLAEAENRFEKSKLKQEGVSTAIISERQIQLDNLALEQARQQVEALKARIEWHTKASEASYRVIVSKRLRAENKVLEIKRGLEGFQVKADRDGVAVYNLKWNGERYQVGEACWSGLPLIQIPDLNTILVEGFVPEVDIGKLKLGQRAEITIDAFPGRSYTGRVSNIGTLVRAKAWDIPNKVLEIQIALDRLDTGIMRPAMSVKARVERGTLSNVIAVPLKAVRTTSAGSFVKLKTDAGWRDQKVEVGESNGTDAVILQGLKPGDLVAADYSRPKQKA
jgi:HlyD family secretion protein